jgi:hypothetical protein
MVAGKSAKVRRITGPYSRALRRGCLRDTLDGRSALGRFARDLERQLLDHVGGHASIVQKLLIERAVAAAIQIDAFEKKVAGGGNWSTHDERTYLGLITRQQRLLRELGLKPVATKTPMTVNEYFAHKRAGAVA